MIALKIQWELEDGKRANGAITVKGDHGLIAKGGSAWQCIDGANSYEIRMIDDDRDVSQYEGIEGIEVLRGVDEINAALEQLEADQPESYQVDKEVVLMALQDPNHPEWGGLSRITGSSLQDEAEAMWQDGVPGVKRVKKRVLKISTNGKLKTGKG